MQLEDRVCVIDNGTDALVDRAHPTSYEHSMEAELPGSVSPLGVLTKQWSFPSRHTSRDDVSQDGLLNFQHHTPSLNVLTLRPEIGHEGRCVVDNVIPLGVVRPSSDIKNYECSLISWNIAGLRTKFNNPLWHEYALKQDIICLQETWFKYPLHLNGYKTFHTQAIGGLHGRAKGGLCIYVTNKLNAIKTVSQLVSP